MNMKRIVGLFLGASSYAIIFSLLPYQEVLSWQSVLQLAAIIVAFVIHGVADDFADAAEKDLWPWEADGDKPRA